jgi:5-methylcytosine-specific restriction protein A
LQLEVDHIVNRARGGLDDEENLQALCIPCHKQKTAAESAEGAGRA